MEDLLHLLVEDLSQLGITLYRDTYPQSTRFDEILLNVDPSRYKELMAINDYANQRFSDEEFFNVYYQRYYWDKEKVDIFNNRTLTRYLGDREYGDEERWYPNGNKEYIIRWVDGFKHGDEEWWIEDGSKTTHIRWNDGKKDGTEKTWYADGTIRSVMGWKNERKDGYQEEWEDDGSRSMIIQWKDGDIISEKYF